MGEPQFGCGGCRAWHHLACWNEAGGRCGACKAPVAPLAAKPSPKGRRPRKRELAIATAVGLVGFGVALVVLSSFPSGLAPPVAQGLWKLSDAGDVQRVYGRALARLRDDPRTRAMLGRFEAHLLEFGVRDWGGNEQGLHAGSTTLTLGARLRGRRPCRLEVRASYGYGSTLGDEGRWRFERIRLVPDDDPQAVMDLSGEVAATR